MDQRRSVWADNFLASTIAGGYERATDLSKSHDRLAVTQGPSLDTRHSYHSDFLLGEGFVHSRAGRVSGPLGDCRRCQTIQRRRTSGGVLSAGRTRISVLVSRAFPSFPLFLRLFAAVAPRSGNGLRWRPAARRPFSLSIVRFEKGPLLELLERLLELLLGVHHDRTVPRHWFLERLARNQQEADPVFAGLHGNLVTAVEENE